jgi:hypothetical protein
LRSLAAQLAQQVARRLMAELQAEHLPQALPTADKVQQAQETDPLAMKVLQLLLKTALKLLQVAQ